MKVLLSLLWKMKIYQREIDLPIAPFPGMGIDINDLLFDIDYVKYMSEEKYLVVTVQMLKYKGLTKKQKEQRLKKGKWKQVA